MAEIITKDEVLVEIDRTYNELEELIAPLNEEQMTRPEVNGPWSIKDNLAHLSVWLRYLQHQLEGVISGKKPEEDFEPGLNRNWSEDEENMYFYQKNKDRPLPDVLTEFRANHALVKETLLSMSEETFNKPLPWDGSGRPLVSLVAGNTFSHYEEHSGTIRRWLEHSPKS